MQVQIDFINDVPGTETKLYVLDETGKGIAVLGNGETDAGSCVLTLDKQISVSVTAPATGVGAA